MSLARCVVSTASRLCCTSGLPVRCTSGLPRLSIAPELSWCVDWSPSSSRRAGMLATCAASSRPACTLGPSQRTSRSVGEQLRGKLAIEIKFASDI